MPIWLWSGIVVYLLGFVVVWVLVAKPIVSDTRNKPRPANVPLQPPSGGVA
jgi:bacteriorhodopsin